MTEALESLRLFLKGKQVQGVERDKNKLFIHFNDCVLEIHGDVHICQIIESSTYHNYSYSSRKPK